MCEEEQVVQLGISLLLLRVFLYGCRPPELLCLRVQQACYGCEVDLWAVGCMLAEFMLGHRLWQGDKQSVLSQIQHVCGSLPDHILQRAKCDKGRFEDWCAAYCC